MCPAALIRVLCHLACGKVARSITDTVLEGSPGIRSCSSQRLKMSASTLASVNPTHNKTPAGSAPMTLTRPLAFQSCCPGQPRGSLVHHAVHTHRCAACHGQNHSRRYRQWAGHRAHKHQSFPEIPAARPGLLSGASGLFICHLYVTPGLPSACHMAFGVISNRAARSYWQAAGWPITSCASFSGSIFRTFRRSRGLGAIRLVQRLIEAMPTENRSAVSPKLGHSFYRTARTCRPKGTGYVIINSIT